MSLSEQTSIALLDGFADMNLSFSLPKLPDDLYSSEGRMTHVHPLEELCRPDDWIEIIFTKVICPWDQSPPEVC